ncbi:hypothetical protein M758_4G198700 [Ceratodon purpureus]|nr:hypothetical protein M758_4G198700 [Ceratodon purpureus]
MNTPFPLVLLFQFRACTANKGITGTKISLSTSNSEFSQPGWASSQTTVVLFLLESVRR